jgi:glycosyltransferase involved in cell wall biosynthesis
MIPLPFPKTGVVSHILPPSPSGQAMVLYRLLEDISPDRYCLMSRVNYKRDGEGGVGRLPARTHYLGPAFRLNVTDRLRLSDAVVPVNTAFEVVHRARQILRVVREESCDLVLACSGDLCDLPAAYLASRWAQVPCIAYMFDDYAYQWTGVFRSISRRLEPMVLKKVKGVIVPNEHLQREYGRRYGILSKVIRNPCLLPDIAALDLEDRVFDPEGIHIVYTGAVYHAHYDAFRNLVSAIEGLGRPDVRLHLYTSQPEAEIARIGIRGPAVSIHPHILPSQVPGVLRQASILFLPLGFDTPIPEVIRTSAPGKTGEYLSAGRPILVHAPGDSFLSWYFRENRCGIVVDRSDADQLSSAIGTLLADETLRSDLGARARSAAERDFDLEAVRPRFREALVAFAEEGRR